MVSENVTNRSEPICDVPDSACESGKIPANVLAAVLDELAVILAHGFGCLVVDVHDGEAYVKPTRYIRFKLPIV